MLQRVMLDGIELPRLYIAENMKDIKLAKDKGIPFIRWSKGQDALIKMLLRPVLERMFPHIKWDKVLGEKKKFRTKVEIQAGNQLEEQHDKDDDSLAEKADNTSSTKSNKLNLSREDEDGTLYETAGIAKDKRYFSSKGHENDVEMLSIEEYVGDMSSYVNIEVLQRLRLMPAFIGDILDCVKINLTSGLYWREGYNKKLGLAVGRYDSSRQLPNLIILDVSGSIPRGISATMIALIDTLRSQLSADLIITGSMSRFYPMDSKLPNPDSIRWMFGYGNETVDFSRILEENIKGHHYGHVFSFGDNDAPARVPSLAGTTVEHVHHYHTSYKTTTGYAGWCHKLQKKPLVEYDISWCDMIWR